MSQYLDVDGSAAAYFPPGVTPTAALVLRASAIIDGYCKRAIEVKSYKERIPLSDRQRGHVSYWPVVAVTSVKGRPTAGPMGTFFGPAPFEELAADAVDIDMSIGTVWCGLSPFGSRYGELEIEYTSGWSPIPESVKVACGILVGKLSSTHDTNVKMKKDFDFTIEYFGTSLITPDVADLLAAYVQCSFR
ncbi:hypothetical protein [Paenibacillus cymbidii]|uniref:hypothetical protein n=1 Tax=Paenibacillus cymbidii TaxID=1639034 RepID=UPI0010813ADC|nr:hypothetical protein [Paenibacillus cymbidii]